MTEAPRYCLAHNEGDEVPYHADDPDRPRTDSERKPEKPKRRRFSADYKLRILEEADRCTKPGELGLLLRREGLYSSHLAEWRRWRRRKHPEHPASRKPPTVSQLRHELARSQRENARLRLKLEHAEKLAALQKKFTEMLEAQQNDEIDGSSA